MSKQAKRNKPSVVAVVGYEIDAEFDVDSAERLLKRAVAEGVVTQYDIGKGDYMWFNGVPGTPLRELRRALVALTTPEAVQEARRRSLKKFRHHLQELRQKKSQGV